MASFCVIDDPQRFQKLLLENGENITIRLDGMVRERKTDVQEKVSTWFGRKVFNDYQRNRKEQAILRLMDEFIQFTAKKEIEQKRNRHGEDHDAVSRLTDFFLDVTSKDFLVENSKKKNNLRERVEFQKSATFYRAGGKKEKSSGDNSEIFGKLLEKVTNWKCVEKKLLYVDKNTLNEREHNQLKKLSKYPRFASTLLDEKDFTLSGQIFTALLQYNLPVSLVVRNPVLIKFLLDKHLMGAIGRGGKGAIRIREEEIGERIKQWVEIRIERQWVKFSLNPDENPGAKTIRSLVNGFAKGTPDNCHWSYTPHGGFERWNPYTFERYDEKGKAHPVSLEGNGYSVLDRMPLYERLSEEQALRRYGETFEKGSHHLVLRASSQDYNTGITGTHGYYDLVLRETNDEGEVSFRIFPIGKYVHTWPNHKNPLAVLSFLGKTTRGTMAYPDPNDIMARRVQCFVPIPLGREETDIVVEAIRQAMVESREGRCIFQLAGDNCMRHAEDILNQLEKKLCERGMPVPDVIKNRPTTAFDLREMNAGNPLLDGIFRILKNCRNPRLQNFLTNILLGIFGMSRKYKVVVIGKGHKKKRISICVMNRNPKIRQGTIFSPPKLIQDVLKNKRKGTLHFGFSGIPQPLIFPAA